MPSLLRFSLAFVAVTAPTISAAQSVPAPAAEARARVIAASFTKSKHVSREKRGVRKEKFVEVTGKPVVKANPAAYSGTYRDDFGFSLDLRVAADGRVQGTGHDVIESESSVMRPFTLVNGRVEGALLTATKTYANGASERFEGDFLDRPIKTSPTDPGSTAFGLGSIGNFGHVAGITLTKLFYQLVRQERQ